jgi:hypothetical protein
MSVRGSLGTMSADDLLAWIERRALTGSLTVERGGVVRTLRVEAARVVEASSNDPNEHLGQLLLRTGRVDETALAEAFATSADTGVALGKILVMIGSVDEPLLRQVLETKIREAVCELLTWSEGAFQFEAGPTGSSSTYPISVDLASCLALGRGRAARWAAIRLVVPSDEDTLWIKSESRAVAKGDDAASRAETQRLLELVRRGLSVGQMVLESGGERFAVLDRLARLLERDAVAIDRRSEAANAAASDAGALLDAAREHARAGDRHGALELAGRALTVAPEDVDVRGLYRELERSIFAELSRDLLTRFRVPRLLKSRDELAGIELSAAERYLAGRVDGRWDLLSLMRVAPLREVETLITFKRLADRGIIAL